ncbi:MAG TPA: ATP-dependent DNA helicase PcrA, partial [Desulfuromonadaceae bacterium]
RERLYLLNARRRYLFGQEQANPPSRFLNDIPPDLLDEEGTPSPYPAPSGRGESFHPEGGQRPDFRHNLAAAAAFSRTSEVEIVPEPPEEHEGVFIGMKVRHSKFGVGTIRKIEGMGEGQKVIVWFSSAGPKKLMLRFAGLERA